MPLIYRLLMLVFVALLSSNCSSFFYYPDDIIRTTPRQDGFEYEEITLTTRDKMKIKAWHIRPEIPAHSLVLHFHGNAQNMSTHYYFVKWLLDYGFEVVTFDYRGYGASAGEPDPDGLIRDGVAAIQYAEKQNKDFFIIAQSLGGAVAVPAVARFSAPPANLRALIIESSFSSYRRIARDKLGDFWLTWPLQWPLSFIVADGASPDRYAAKVRTPVLVLHGDSDPIVDDKLGQELYEEFKNAPKKFVKIPKGGHTPAFLSNDPKWRNKVMGYMCGRHTRPQVCLDGVKAGINIK